MKRQIRLQLILLAWCVVVVEGTAFQKNKQAQRESNDSVQTENHISLLPFKGINPLSENVLGEVTFQPEGASLQGTSEPPAASGSREKSSIVDKALALASSIAKKAVESLFPKGRIALKLLGFSACVASIGTLILLRLSLLRRKHPAATKALSEMQETVPVADDEPEPYEDMEYQRARESIGAMIRDEAANVAHLFHRNREEFHLTMKFQRHQNTDRMAEKIERMKQQPVLDTIVVAKQAGFGRGEVELAMHLNDIQQSMTQSWGVR